MTRQRKVFSALAVIGFALMVALPHVLRFYERQAEEPSPPLAVDVASPRSTGNDPVASVPTAEAAAPGTDEVDRRCQELAAAPSDSQRIGSGVPFDQIKISEALPVCEQAATRQPPRPRYQFLYGRVLDGAARYADAAQQYSRAEQAGYAVAAASLGELYRAGQGVSQDFAKAATLFRKAVNGGASLGAYGLGLIYELGQGVPKDWGEAAKWYQKAGDDGDAEGYTDLAALHAQGANFAEAVKWAQKAAQGGSGKGYESLGWHYETGNGVQQDPAKAAQLYSEAAKRGNPDAMFRLGHMYRHGLGVQPDPRTGCQWLYQSTQSGRPDGHYALRDYAQEELGSCYYRGDGGTKDLHAAFTWYLRAAQAGIVVSQVFVAGMYELGEGVPPNDAEAVAWLRKAADQGHAYAMTQLGVHLRQGTGVAVDDVEAMQWFRKAADKGYDPAQVALGLGFVLGRGQGTGQGKPDFTQAAYWFTEASQQGNPMAQINLAILYENGWGVTRDLQKARDLFLQASNSPTPEIASQAKELAAQISSPASAPPARPQVEASDTLENVFWGIGAAGAMYLAYKILTGPSGKTDSSVDSSSAAPRPYESGVGGLRWENRAVGKWGVPCGRWDSTC